MCGIVGILHRDRGRQVDAAVLSRMRDTLEHRGPDASGAFVSGPVGLGHRRLSIIDVSGGQQPMASADGAVHIVFNGEIYNYRELRERLEARGRRFRTASDTEVILQLYEEEGPACVRSLNGIFAFAIWDERDRSLFIARDHMGVKPLYYVLDDEVLLFASEPKALFESGRVTRRCREQGVFEYFVFRHVAGPRTLWEDVMSLPPAHTLLWRDGKARIEAYWSPLAASPRGFRDADEATEALAALLEDAVSMQMVSDVPLGTFCSGGVDSSLVTALAARRLDQPINTFSVGFEEADYDETAFARMVSARYGTRHHELRVDHERFAQLLPEMIRYQDAPLNFANSVQIYAISRLAKSSVTVVLTGEGADELFAGYPRYLLPGLAARYRHVPRWLRAMAGSLGKAVGEHRLAKLDQAARRSPDQAVLYNASFVSPELVAEVVAVGGQEHLAWRTGALEDIARVSADPVTRLSLLDQQSYLVSILERQDKMSMAASIESRVPFLDWRVVEFANGLDVRYKVGESGVESKSIVKRVARRFLPDEVIDRRKSGFGVPLRAWLNGNAGLGAYVEQLLAERDLDAYLRRERMSAIVDAHRRGRADHAEFLWTAINFMLWRRSFG